MAVINSLNLAAYYLSGTAVSNKKVLKSFLIPQHYSLILFISA